MLELTKPAFGKPVQLVRVPDEGVPKAGVVKVGDVLNTLDPDPVEVVTPVPPDRTGNVPVVKTEVEDAYTAPLAVNEVRFVPPFAVLKVPAKVTVPVVAVFGVKPVVPALNEVPADGVCQDRTVPLDVRT
jgi:hypothetical protein